MWCCPGVTGVSARKHLTTSFPSPKVFLSPPNPIVAPGARVATTQRGARNEERIYAWADNDQPMACREQLGERTGSRKVRGIRWISGSQSGFVHFRRFQRMDG